MDTPDLLGMRDSQTINGYRILEIEAMECPLMTFGTIDSPPICLEAPSPPKYQYQLPLPERVLPERVIRRNKKEKQIQTILGNTPLRIPSSFKMTGLSQASQRIVKQLSSKRVPL